MLMKSTPGVNFINILRTAFMLIDPKSIKKIDNLTDFFTLLGSARLKAVRRTLIKLSPGVTGSISHQNCVQLFGCTNLEVITRMLCTLCQKFSLNLLVQKMLVKCW
jgi:hypothetical protein